MLKHLNIFLIIVILFCPTVSIATEEQHLKDMGGPLLANDYELQYLPPYCKCRAALNKDRYRNEKKKWGRIFKSKGDRGKDWMHVHHYCFGLISLSRLQRGLGKRSALLAHAENEFNYVIRQSSPKFILMPEVHLKMGITQKLMGKNIKAMKHFIQATKLKRDYVPAYIHIIDYYKDNHDFESAIRTAKTGLKYSPNSKVLKQKVIELQSLAQ